MPTSPVACSLDATGYRSRQAEWQALSSEALREHSRTATGMRLTFAAQPGVEDRLEALAALERECCAFATWTVSRGAETVTLTVESDGEGTPAIWELFAPDDGPEQ